MELRIRRSILVALSLALMSCQPPRVRALIRVSVGDLGECLLGGGAPMLHSVAPKCLEAHGGKAITYAFSSSSHELQASVTWKIPSKNYPVLTPACSAEIKDQISSQLFEIRERCPPAELSPPWYTACTITTYGGPFSKENHWHGEICPNPVEVTRASRRPTPPLLLHLH